MSQAEARALERLKSPELGLGLADTHVAAIDTLIKYATLRESDNAQETRNAKLRYLQDPQVKASASILANLLDPTRPGEHPPDSITRPLTNMAGTLTFVAAARGDNNFISILAETHFVAPPPGAISSNPPDRVAVVRFIALSHAYWFVYHFGRTSLGMSREQQINELEKYGDALKPLAISLGSDTSLSMETLATRPFMGPGKAYAREFAASKLNKDVLGTRRSDHAWESASGYHEIAKTFRNNAPTPGTDRVLSRGNFIGAKDRETYRSGETSASQAAKMKIEQDTAMTRSKVGAITPTGGAPRTSSSPSSGTFDERAMRAHSEVPNSPSPQQWLQTMGKRYFAGEQDLKDYIKVVKPSITAAKPGTLTQTRTESVKPAAWATGYKQFILDTGGVSHGMSRAFTDDERKLMAEPIDTIMKMKRN